jgi:hypothetical protein
MFKYSAFINEMNKNYELLVPPILKLTKKSAKSQEVARKIKHFYLGDKPVSIESMQPLFDVSNTHN